ncbi:MAG: PQQ-binding-like beta-propeller repeat protein [Phycisphaerales bacterium]|nr:MAG: PQQ-binding-like beta-propeller repeat protein [Phycisphaerales bacterium]
MQTKPWLLTIFVSLLCAHVPLMAQGNHDQKAKQILDSAGFKGGIIVHLGCGDGILTAALHADKNHIVHGLDTDVQAVQAAREYVRKQEIYGPVSIEHFDGKSLPYTGNLVNLVVAEKLAGVPKREIMRVLAPGGTLYARQNGRWSKTVKPRPANIDEWTHYLHDPSGNAVAHDEVVGPPRHIQWVGGPRYDRSHEHIPNLYALVSTGGRIFYILDEASLSSIRVTPQWRLIARDAFNGTLLWKKKVGAWFPHIVNWGGTPRQLQRKLVAVDDLVYVTLGIHAPVTEVDAATGRTIRVYDGTKGAEEIVLHKGILLLAVRSVTDERTAELAKWAQMLKRRSSPADARETAAPLVKQLRAIEGRGTKSVVALDVDTGKQLWKKDGADASGLRTNTLCAEEDRAFYQNGSEVVCLDLKTGRILWSESSATLRCVYDGIVYCSGGRTVTARSAKNGHVKWTKPTLLTQIRDLFVAGGSVWVGGFKPFPSKRGPSWGPYFATQLNPATGEVMMHIEPENPSHHHRCYSNKATDRYILAGRRGTEFVDLAAGEVLWNSWARGACKYGVMPANGLLYTPPHPCGCYIGVKLTGFHALSATIDKGRWETDAAQDRLEKGPAYKQIVNAKSKIENPQGWPTYRSDAERSGYAPTQVPAVLRPRWQLKIGGKLTAPVVADGKIFLASVDQHSLCAIDADSGKSVWRFTTGARVDSPPTLYQGQAIFGSRDGHIYGIRASDGELAWRLRAAREDRRIAAYGQLESASPALGSVLVRDGVLYATAGRSSYLDGGIDLYRIEPHTGSILSRTPIYSPDPETGRQPKQFGPAAMPGVRADILTGDDNHIYLRDMVFNAQGVNIAGGKPHLFTLTDFLDDFWTHRSFWIFGTKPSISTGCSGRDRNLIFGRLIVFNESNIYGYGRKQVHWSNMLQDGPYRVFGMNRGGRPREPRWEKAVPIQVRAMVLADKVIFAAGLLANEIDGPDGPDKDRGAALIALSADDGAELGRCSLDSVPVFDGMAAAYGRLHISMRSGSLVCLGK